MSVHDPGAIPRPRWWVFVSSVAGLIALFGGWVWAETLQPDGSYDPVRQTISVLAGHGATDRWLMESALYVIGACHLISAAGLRGARRSARVALTIAGFSGLGLAVFSQPKHGATPAHLTWTVIGVLALAAFCSLVAERGERRFPLRIRDGIGVGVVSVALLIWVLQAAHSTDLGLAERVITGQQTLWPLLVAIALRRRGSYRVRNPARVERVVTGK